MNPKKKWNPEKFREFFEQYILVESGEFNRVKAIDQFADYVGVSPRTAKNWISLTSPTTPYPHNCSHIEAYCRLFYPEFNISDYFFSDSISDSLVVQNNNSFHTVKDDHAIILSAEDDSPIIPPTEDEAKRTTLANEIYNLFAPPEKQINASNLLLPWTIAYEEIMASRRTEIIGILIQFLVSLFSLFFLLLYKVIVFLYLFYRFG